MRVLTDRADRLQWAGDASIYHLVPEQVAFPETVADVQALLRRGQPITFRAGGTSLSGQAVTDRTLAVASQQPWRDITVLDGGAQVRCGPGAVGAWVNAALAPYGRKIGPDPASLQAAEIGGIVANNASGMCCGVHHNSYRTVTCLELVLADGTHLHTDDDARFAALRPDLHRELARLRDQVRGNADLRQRIERAFATKNTIGYALNALLDEAQPVRILQKLVIGSEGTLAFIASATLRTVPVPRHRVTAWQLYPDIDAACAAVPRLAAHAAAVELLDAVSLRRVSAKLPHPLPDGEPAALLIELQHDDPFALGDAQRALPELTFTADAAIQARYWSIRKGLFPSVGAVRASGTAVVIEDVTFPVQRLAEGVRGLRRLFSTHGYDDAVIFGHAKDGNLHFTLTPDLSQAVEITRYAAFMSDLAALVLGMDGHLKAEHGTGRNMAPFVEAQWGPDAVDLMRTIKRLLDPAGILNPGVLLSDDPQAHLRHLKTLPAAHPLVDACIECGFCEPTCPSRDASTSPRQRIQLLRAAARGESIPDATIRSIDSCAGDGLCATACPVQIDTGAVMRELRAVHRSAPAQIIANACADHLPLLTTLGRIVLQGLGGTRPPGAAIPLPPAARVLPHAVHVSDDAPVYLWMPTCLSRTLGTVADDLMELCHRAGVSLELPDQHDSLCCGQAFASKGFPAQARRVQQRTAAACAGTNRQIITDTATCAAHLGFPVIDPATFAATVLMPRLGLSFDASNAAGPWLHPTCADTKHGWDQALRTAIPHGRVPLSAGCCGMAGDKGWTTPALSAAATARERAETAGEPIVTTGMTCAAALGGEHVFTWLRRQLG